MEHSPDPTILIIGAGCFGISTAYWLLKDGFRVVKVIDRAKQLPAIDGASNDYNRIIRTSYPDFYYAALAQEAIDLWKLDGLKESYHEGGVISLCDSSKKSTEKAFQNDSKLGLNIRKLKNQQDIQNSFPPGVETSFEGLKGYINHQNGWADAHQAMVFMIEQVQKMGGEVIPDKSVKALIRTPTNDGVITKGVWCMDGAKILADMVIIATGAFTSSNFPELKLNEKCRATSQIVATVQLNKEETEAYRDCPVVINFDTGYYCFPPTNDDIMKMAFHRSGFGHTEGQVSMSSTFASRDGETPNEQDMLSQLRVHFKNTYPKLAETPFSGTRLCWYTDTPDEDWIIGRYPQDSSLFLATGGSGHAYKFLPIIGRLVSDAVQDKLDFHQTKRFAVKRILTQTGKQ
ncbi:FAD dependent oxidoreductase [Dendrothele bispora CBS 962.96]|uniref:FAD dependent oxidoreductase n=1 Tax=Dendrothele bispora (strain CBS 962.96) TaxID=1314807 RepID=A0A4S8LXQ2_DENBC|nr:FAD dependent oxidoreductase [Dendrothele bispora CBS 962.96]